MKEDEVSHLTMIKMYLSQILHLSPDKISDEIALLYLGGEYLREHDKGDFEKVADFIEKKIRKYSMVKKIGLL